MKDFLSSADVSERLGVGIAQVSKLVKEGRLPAVRNGRRLVFPRAAWETFVAQQSAAALATLQEVSNADA